MRLLLQGAGTTALGLNTLETTSLPLTSPSHLLTPSTPYPLTFSSPFLLPPQPALTQPILLFIYRFPAWSR